MRIKFINNNGGGFADEVTVPEGMSIEQFVQERIGANYRDYNIRVNRQEVVGTETLRQGDTVSVIPVAGQVAAATPLRTGDRVTVTPKNVAGAILEFVVS